MEKIALVTGSTNNIGKAIAEVLAGKGYHVIITSRNEGQAQAVSENLPKKGSYFSANRGQACKNGR
jgi:short-subunit dehydrogenase